ncbi:MAG: hypothetical protein V3V32_04490 [Dehalococcoidia bacterium]
MTTLARMFVSLGLDSSEYDRGLKSAKGSLRSFASDLQKTSKVISGAAAVIGVLGIAAVKQAAATEEVRGAFNRLAKDFGANADSMLKALDKAAVGTVSDYDLMLTANKAMALGVGRNVEEMATLLEIARLKGKAFGRTTTEAFNDIAIGIGRQSRLILDNIGIIVDVETANKRYADSLGKTVKQLTDAETRQAFLNTVLEEGRAQLAAAGEIGISTAEKFQRLQATVANVTVEIGTALLPVANELFDLLETSLVPAVQDLANAFAGLSPEQIRAIAISVGALAGLWPAITAVKAMSAAVGVLFGVLTSPIAIAAGAALATFLSPALDPEMMAGLSIKERVEADALAMGTQDRRLKQLGLRYDETAVATQKMTEQAKAGVAAWMDSSRGANTAARAVREYGGSVAGAADKTKTAADRLREYRDAMRAVSDVKFIGEAETSDQLFRMGIEAKNVQKQLLEMGGRGAEGAEEVEKALDDLRRQMDILRLQAEITFEPQQRMIERLVNPIRELAMQEKLNLLIALEPRVLSDLQGAAEAMGLQLEYVQGMPTTMPDYSAWEQSWITLRDDTGTTLANMKHMVELGGELRNIVIPGVPGGAPGQPYTPGGLGSQILGGGGQTTNNNQQIAISINGGGNPADVVDRFQADPRTQEYFRPRAKF